MKPRRLCFALLVASSTSSATDISFSRDIIPALRNQCATCHVTGEGTAGLALHPAVAFRNLVGVASSESDLLRVSPGKPQDSYLLRKVEGTHLDAGGEGARMPMDADTIEKLRLWIEQGAKDN